MSSQRAVTRSLHQSERSPKTGNRRFSYREFIDFCLLNEQEQQDSDYIFGQARRLYNSYSRLVDKLEPGDTVLSAGIGSGYLEAALAETVNIQIIGADFEQSLLMNRDFLESYNIEFVPTDLTRDDPFPQGTTADLVISAEIVEHLNQPPTEHLRKLSNVLEPGGALYLTTPNLVRLRIIAKLLLGESYLAPPDDLFAPISYEHEGVHRREYVREEMEDAVAEAGLELFESGFGFNRSHRSRDWRLWLLYPFERMIPRIRPIMYFFAKTPARNTEVRIEEDDAGGEAS